MPDFSIFLRDSYATITVTADKVDYTEKPPLALLKSNGNTVAVFPIDAINSICIASVTRVTRPSSLD